MKYTPLGNTGIPFSWLCVGCVSFGQARTMRDWTQPPRSALSCTRWSFDQFL